MKEVKITFTEGTEIRVLRGIIEAEDETFIILKRRDGTRRINKRYISCISDEETEPAGEWKE